LFTSTCSDPPHASMADAHEPSSVTSRCT
jgi:hypothetical protein